MNDNEPMVDPVACSLDDLKEIIETDPDASPAYQRELTRREARQAEVDHYEDIFGVER